MTWVDKCVYNVLNDVFNGPRCAAIIQKDGTMRIYLYGGEYVAYDPKENLIILLPEYRYQGTAEIDEWSIDLDQIKELYKKLTAPSAVHGVDDDLNIGSVKPNTEKGQELIKKYRDAFKDTKKD
jgi:hypothetical protein